MKLLLQVGTRNAAARDRLRLKALAQVKASLVHLLPGEPVWLFGSLVRAGGLAVDSDVDIALEREPAATPLYRLQSLLSERVGREGDIVTPDHCRFAEAIRRQGTPWTASS